ncbi:MAG: hypothetical protein SWK76_12625 [Actinomycetota bacterium]|nr:hypothetical protein [Actinomycetota bacterium]
MEFELEGEVELTESGMIAHFVSSMMGEKVDSYIIGDQCYSNITGQGWIHTNLGTYRIQNPGMALISEEEIELITGLGEKAEMVEKNEDAIYIFLYLDEEFFEASMEAAWEYYEKVDIPEYTQWLDTVEEMALGFRGRCRYMDPGGQHAHREVRDEIHHE